MTATLPLSLNETLEHNLGPLVDFNNARDHGGRNNRVMPTREFRYANFSAFDLFREWERRVRELSKNMGIKLEPRPQVPARRRGKRK